MVFGQRTIGWLCQYAIFPTCFFMLLQGLIQAIAPMQFFANAPFSAIKKHIYPHLKKLVGSDETYLKGIVPSIEEGAKDEQLTKGLISMLIHILRLFGVFNVTIGAYGIYIGIAVGRGLASGWTAWAFMLTFYVTFVGFQLVHVYQPFPGEPKIAPWGSILLGSVIFLPILILDLALKD